MFFIACSTKTGKQDTLLIVRNAEAREDSLEMIEALSRQNMIEFAVTATAETEPVKSLEGEDAADDPAIWVNPNNAEQSLVLGTNKKGGVYVYDLDGNTKQFIDCGHINNIDLKNGFYYKGKVVSLVTGTNRSLNTISVFVIDPDSVKLSNVIANIPSGVSEVYGICNYYNTKEQKHYSIVNGKDFQIEQWYLNYESDSIYYRLIRSFKVSSQLEGMVTNDSTGILYYGVEQEGIFKVDLLNSFAIPEKLADSDSLNVDITYDIEGIALFSYNCQTYLMASSQGSFSYAIFNIGVNDKYVGSFKVINGVIDGVEETDGLEVVSVPLGSFYPNGLIVLQDGFNFDGDSLMNQNFKYVPFECVIPVLNK